ncbi:MAG: xanthan lyase [Paludibacteraceae bacterium]|nr:xanthan lyase [Paludibacteraceae bacterium]
MKAYISSIILFIFSCLSIDAQKNSDVDNALVPVYAFLQSQYPHLKNNRLNNDSSFVNTDKKSIAVYLSKHVEGIALREQIVDAIYDSVRANLPKIYKNYTLKLYTNRYELHDLVPNWSRSKLKTDKQRLAVESYKGSPLVRNLSKPYQVEKGLFNRHIALWPSHGWYFESNTKGSQWQWQRPCIFQIVEDTYTLGYVLPYLAPMLERAGANVLIPRERDHQFHEVVVDNDTPGDYLYEELNGEESVWMNGDSLGFANKKKMYVEGDHPFRMGTYRQIKVEKEKTAEVHWVPEIPEDGEYAVYVSYHSLPESSTGAHYIVNHMGGSTEFVVNQKMGGGTWIYLGTFRFREGLHPSSGMVVLTNQSRTGKFITADAVKFGGGMGNIGRPTVTAEGDTVVAVSDRLRYLEGSRYWLQWAGYPDSIFSRNAGLNDYKDDYMSRGEWVNNLIGGSVMAPNHPGKNIPIDLSMGFHTDAGQLLNDTIVGTLAIYMSESVGRKEYWNGQRRLAGRDLTDMIQTQVVEDIQRVYRSDWTRRKMVDASYYEARVPEVPTMLLELLSHQNFTDMRYGLDPNFRFFVSRSIYKAMLKFIAFQNGSEYVVQPLPVEHFSVEFYDKARTKAFLSWEAQEDSLEPSATPTRYVVYTSRNEGGWDNGRVVETPHFVVPIDSGAVYNFKVAALNEGGESFPSEVLSIYKGPSAKTALIVNGFDRVSAPESFDTGEYSGFLDDKDQGVPDRYDLSYVGKQVGFRKRQKFRSNADPGHGACRVDYEGVVIAGNTFDYPVLHGKSIKNAGYSYVSCSRSAITDANFNIRKYAFVDLILGEQKETTVGQESRYKIFPKPLQEELRTYLYHGGKLFVSGAYIASDIFERDSCDEDDIYFAEKVLKYTLMRGDVDTDGLISNYFSVNKNFTQKYLKFNTTLGKSQYAVESPDALDNVNGSSIVHSFEGSNLPCSVAYKGRYRTFVSTVPFEAITTQAERDALMKDIVNFLMNK